MATLDDIYNKVLQVEQALRDLPSNLRVINADQIFTDSLSAITANMGVLRAGQIMSPNYVPGASGFNMEASTGDAEFQNVTIRGAISSSVLVYNERQSVSGTMIITYSAGKVREDFTTPGALSGTVNVDIDDPPSGHSQLFLVNDIILIQTGSVSAWFTVTAASNQTTFWRYTLRLENGPTNTSVNKGTGAADYGPNTGSGYLEMVAKKQNEEGPYYSVRTHSGSPWSSVTEMIRLGNMRNAYGTGTNNRYGIGIGDYNGGAGNYLSYNAESANKFILKGGNGVLTLDEGGVRIELADALYDPRSYRFTIGGLTVGYLAGLSSLDDTVIYMGAINENLSVARNIFSQVHAISDSNSYTAEVQLVASQLTSVILSLASEATTTDKRLHLVNAKYARFDSTCGLSVGSLTNSPSPGDIWATADGRFGGGLYVGGVSTNPATGEIIATNKLKVTGDGSSYGVYIGTDTQLYRSAANEITTPDGLVIAGNTSDNSVSAINVTSGDSTYATHLKSGDLHPIYLVGYTDMHIGFNAYYNSSWKFGKGSSAKYAGRMSVESGTGLMRFAITDATGNADAAATFVNQFFISQAGDVYSEVWTDYSATSTIVGWSSYTNKQIWYKRIGKIVWVKYFIQGTSNSTTTTFTLPLSAAATPALTNFIQFWSRAQDNGGAFGVGLTVMTYSSNVVDMRKDMTGALFTGSGTKHIVGELWYEAA